MSWFARLLHILGRGHQPTEPLPRPAPMRQPEEPLPESFETTLEKAKAGDAEAQNAVGRLILAGEDPDARGQAEAWFRRAAAQGLPNAKHNLGVLYWSWHDDSQRLQALKWFEEAANDGWVNSQFALGACLSELGREAEAIKFFEMAARQGHGEAQDSLGKIYFDRDTEEDNVKARHWTELAVAQGIVSAQARMGLIFHEGRGTPRDPKRAAAHFLAAAEAGDPGAQMFIGGFYENGIGVPADKIEAAYWYGQSIRQGNELAKAMLESLLRHMTRDEVNEAMRRSGLEPL